MSTASGLEREYHCPASAVLPAVTTHGAAAVRGVDIHAFVRRVLGGMTRAAALAFLSKESRATCEAIDFQRIVGDLHDVRSEVAYALNVRTDEVRELGFNIGRAYPDLGADWVYGTLDIEGMRLDDVPVAPDIKTGFADVTPPAENFQLGFFGRVLALKHGASEIDARILKIRTDGSVWTDPGSYDQFAIDEWGDRLIEVVDGVAKARAEYKATGVAHVSPGSWCKYCPAFHACPAKVALASRMLPELQAIDGRVAAMTPEQRGRAWVVAHDQIAPLLDGIVEALKESATIEPFPLPNGKWLAETRQERDSFDKAVALALLRQLGATEAQLAACHRTIEVKPVKEVRFPKAAKPIEVAPEPDPTPLPPSVETVQTPGPDGVPLVTKVTYADSWQRSAGA
jgi:hypothetical protein